MAGDIMQYEGQMQTNAANEQMVSQQEAFQAQMSNTAYQRSTADMKAAGINPMLAVSNGGASSPAGAIAPMTSPTQVAGQALEKLGPQLISSANDVVRTKAAADVAASQASANYASASKSIAEQAEVPSQISANSASAARQLQDAATSRAQKKVYDMEGMPMDVINKYRNMLDGTDTFNSASKVNSGDVNYQRPHRMPKDSLYNNNIKVPDPEILP